MSNKSTAKKAKAVSATLASDPDSLVRFADLLKLRSMSVSTQEDEARSAKMVGPRFA
jgi:hypothetical protein